MDEPNIKSGINGEFVPGYPICQGCENLTIIPGVKWYCSFKLGTRECEYSDKMPPKNSESLIFINEKEKNASLE